MSKKKAPSSTLGAGSCGVPLGAASPWATGVHVLRFWPSHGTTGSITNPRNFRKSTVLKLPENDTFLLQGLTFFLKNSLILVQKYVVWGIDWFVWGVENVQKHCYELLDLSEWKVPWQSGARHNPTKPDPTRQNPTQPDKTRENLTVTRHNLQSGSTLSGDLFR